MKIYTGTGDKGKTSLFSGERLLKSDPRIDAYGEIDELSSFIGAVKAALEVKDPDLNRDLGRDVDRIQEWLLAAGAWMATTPGSGSAACLTPFTEQPAQYLETAIDDMSAELSELKAFILPQGHLSAANAHIARTVCRRAERRIISFARDDDPAQPVTETLTHILVFLNRLSDYLFVLARYLNKAHGMDDTLWNARP